MNTLIAITGAKIAFLIFILVICTIVLGCGFLLIKIKRSRWEDNEFMKMYGGRDKSSLKKF